MKVLEISRAEFVKDRDSMKVSEIKEKYGINNAALYKIINDLGLEKMSMSERTQIKLVD